MAGPSSTSGVGANLGFIPGPDYSPIEKGIAQIVAAHEQKKQNAAQEFDRLMKAVDMGLPVDPKQIEGTLKKSGIKLMQPDEMKAHLQAKQSGAADNLLKPTGATGATGVAAGAQPNRGTQTQSPTGAVAGAKQTQKQAQQSLLSGLVQHRLEIAKMKGETEENQLKLQNTLSTLHNEALNGNAEALGKLMAHNDIPFNLQAQAWQKGTPEQRQKMMDVARGAETDAQVAARKDAIYGQLMSDGRFKDPSMGMKAAEIIAKGGELPTEVRNSMVPNTMSDLVKESQFGNQLIEMGVPPDQVGTIAANAQKVGLANALPTGMRPLAVRQIEFEGTKLDLEHQKVGLEGKKVDLETQRVGIEKDRSVIEIARIRAEEAHYQAMAAAADAKMKLEFISENRKQGEASAKADLEMFKSLAEVKKLNPSAVSDDMIKAAQNKAMKAMGWTETETKGFWNHITGGLIPTMNRGFRPQMTPSGQSTIDKSIGGGSTSDSAAQRTVGAIGKAIKSSGSHKINPGSDETVPNEEGPN